MTLPTSGPTAQSNPDAFVGRVTLSAYEPYPFFSGSQYSSVAPGAAAVIRWVQPGPVGIRNIVLQNSLSASVPDATSAASAGSEAYSYAVSAFIYSRQDYAANSSNLFPVVSGSFGLTATLSYTSTGQSYGMSWVTDTTGGASTFSTASNSGNWSNYGNGPRVYSLPLVTQLTAGEYWIMFQQSSTTATSNSNITLLSMSQLIGLGQQAADAAGYLGQSTTNASVYGAVQNVGVLNSTPTFSTTMPQTFISAGARPIWFALSNA